MIKFRWYYDKDKEEKFLNEMAVKGYAMKKFNLGVYWFEKCSPREYTYRIDLISDKDIKERNEFYDLIRETGGEHIQTWGHWAYFRKNGIFELYTDNQSKIEQYNRIKKIFIMLGIVEMCIVPGQLNMYFNLEIKAGLIIVSLLVLTSIICFYQVYKCNRKITSLRKEEN